MGTAAAPTTTGVVAGVDLSGRLIVITGGAGGLGLETARALVSAGADVLIADRREDRLDAARRQLRAGPGRVEAFELDLASATSVRAFAAELRPGPLDVLVNNAGIVSGELHRDADGRELTIAVNFLGHFLLTGLLMPRLLGHADRARVINLSSGAHRDSPIRFDDVHYRRRAYDPREAYAQSKSATALFSLALTRRVAALGVDAFTVRPAKADTGIFAALTDTARARFSSRVNAGQSGAPLEVAAATTVWAAVAPELSGRSGAYLSGGAVAGEPGAAPGSGDYADWIFDPAAADRLWSLAEDEVGERFSWNEEAP
jgi:NAD(P)-dependent dehydrogenase (short-subunit alcohol dehydrogenase family)